MEREEKRRLPRRWGVERDHPESLGQPETLPASRRTEVLLAAQEHDVLKGTRRKMRLPLALRGKWCLCGRRTKRKTRSAASGWSCWRKLKMRRTPREPPENEELPQERRLLWRPPWQGCEDFLAPLEF